MAERSAKAAFAARSPQTISQTISVGCAQSPCQRHLLAQNLADFMMVVKQKPYCLERLRAACARPVEAAEGTSREVKIKLGSVVAGLLRRRSNTSIGKPSGLFGDFTTIGGTAGITTALRHGRCRTAQRSGRPRRRPWSGRYRRRCGDPEALSRRCHTNLDWGGAGFWKTRSLQAAVAARHVRNASSLKTRSVRREVR